jgi:hypothetical protein
MRAYRTAVAAATSLPVSVAFLSLALATPAEAAPPPPITWGSATTVSGDSDVSTAGTLLYAYNVGGAGVASTTVNGVTFASYAFPASGAFTNSVSVGSVSFVENPGTLWGLNSLGSSGLSSNYQALLGSAGGANLLATITATLNGLTVGNQYQLQVWSNNSGNGNAPYGLPILSTILGSGANQVTLDANTTNAVGGLGQFVLGTFSASGTSMTFTLNGTGALDAAPLINAFQVRDITPIPGPGGAALAAIAGALRLGGRRRR